MKPCDDRWREELADHVLGLRASDALTEHLANCAVCSATRRDWKASMGMIDSGIRELATSEPSPHAASRLMAEIRTRPQHAWARRWEWRTAMVCGLTLAITVLIYGWKVRVRRADEEKVFSAAAAVGGWKSPTETLMRASTERWPQAPLRLGKYFYQIDTRVPEKERANP
jgi:hypothetical protein